MNKPKPEDYGYETATGFDSESGWMIEGGEEAYYEALEKWNKANASFTPGPWFYTKDEHFMYGVYGDPVCRVRGITPDVRNANAALICAAPEMLDLFERIMKIRDLWYPGDDYPEHEAQALSSMDIEIRGIIKKAKGE